MERNFVMERRAEMDLTLFMGRVGWLVGRLNRFRMVCGFQPFRRH